MQSKLIKSIIKAHSLNDYGSTCFLRSNTPLFIIISQGASLSLRRNPSLHALHTFLSFAMSLHVGSTYRIKSSHHLVLGRPRGLLGARGIHYVSDCPSVVMSPRHVCRPSVFAFSYVPDNVCHTTLFVDPDLYFFCPWGWLIQWFSPCSFGLWPISQVECY